jgi:malate dehydrogenase (oxaloacetate-decarboxylating)(NADP+)
LKLGMLFPPQSNILKVEVETAARVARFMFDNGLGTVERPADIRSWVEGQLYHPQF